MMRIKRRYSIKRKVLTALILFFLTLLLSTLTLCMAKSTKNNKDTAEDGTSIARESSIYTKIDQYLRAYEAKGWFSGSVLVAKNDEVIISKGYGMANFEFGVLNTPQTKFHLGSVTKQFTSMSVMQLVEKGLIDVNDTLSKYIPDYPNGKKITVHHLLTHTSGIPDYMNDDDAFSTSCKIYHTIGQLIDSFKNKPLEFQPGTKYEYSNSGYLLLSYIIEKVSGKSYEDYLLENIIKPLNMKNTGYDHLKPLVKNRASGYSIASGKLTNAEFFDRSNVQGADGLYSTVEDLYLWDRALYTEKLVSKSSLDKMFTPYPPANIYGYGWSTNKVEVHHFGRMDGYYTYIYRNTSDKTAIVVLSNIEQSPVNTIGKDLLVILSGSDYRMPDNLTDIKIEPVDQK